MDRYNFCTLIVLILFAISCSGNQETAVNYEELEAQVREAEDKWLSAQFRGDTGTLKRFEEEDCIVVTKTRIVEHIRGKYQIIDSLVAANKLRTQQASFKNETNVRFHGHDVAITYGICRMSIPEEETHEQFYSNVWLKRDGGWKIVLANYREKENN